MFLRQRSTHRLVDSHPFEPNLQLNTMQTEESYDPLFLILTTLRVLFFPVECHSNPAFSCRHGLSLKSIPQITQDLL